jgi:arginine-tRNA-protein transferase
MELEPSSFTKEKFDLYAKYQASIHHDKPEDISQSGFKRFLVDSPMKVEKGTYGSFHQKYMLDGKMIALAIIDILPKCISSVYFIYDPDYAFLSLGKYSVFREIGLVQTYQEKMLELRYYYMGKKDTLRGLVRLLIFFIGFYIHTCPKMNYKGQYHPSDLLDPVDYQWHPIEQFRKKFDQEKLSFVTFNDKKRDYPPGWMDRKDITEDDLNQVFLYAGKERIVPINYLVKFHESTEFRGSIMDYICSVGIELAHKMVIC